MASSLTPRSTFVGDGRVTTRWTLSELLILGGVSTLGMSASLIALRAMTLKPNLFPIFLIAAPLAALLIARPKWIVPTVIGLLIVFSDRASFGGLPSLVLPGALILAWFAVRQGLSRSDLAGEVLIVTALFILPVIGTGLVSGDGAVVPVTALKNIVFLILTALALRSARDVDRVATVLGVVAVLLGVGAAVAALGHPTFLFPLEQPSFPGQEIVTNRVAGPFGDPNFFGLVLASLMPFATYLVAVGGQRKHLGLSAMLFLLVGILATGSRGSVIAVAFALVACAFAMPVKRVRIVVVLTIACAAVAIPFFASQTKEAEQRDVQGRETAARVAVAVFEDNPLAGVGPGRFADHFRDYSRTIGNEDRLVLETHSLPLEIASEQGLIGILAWVAAAFAIVRYAIARRVWSFMLGRAILLSICSYMTASLFLHGGLLKVLWIFIGIFFAFAGSLSVQSDSRRRVPSHSLRRRRVVRFAAAALLSVGIIVAGTVHAVHGARLYSSTAKVALVPDPAHTSGLLDTYRLSGTGATYVELLTSKNLLQGAHDPDMVVSARLIPDTRVIEVTLKAHDRETVQQALATLLERAQLQRAELRDDWHIKLLQAPTVPGSVGTRTDATLIGTLVLVLLGTLAVWTLARPILRVAPSRPLGRTRGATRGWATQPTAP